MKYPMGHHQREDRGRRSASLVLSPYYVEDVAVTQRQFEQLQRSDVMVIVPR